MSECAAPHPERPEVACIKPQGRCFLQHHWYDRESRQMPEHVLWPNPAQPPVATKRKGGIKPKATTGPKTAGTAAEAFQEHVNNSLTQALTAVEAHADGDFKEQAKDALRQVALEQEFLTSEDVLDRVTAVTHENRAMGPVMLWGKREGFIEKTERFAQYRKQSNHQMDSRIWKSLIYKP